MENLSKNKVKDNYTLIPESVYDYVFDKRIKLIDVVVYAAIKCQNDGGYGSSLSDIHRIFNIPYSSVEKSTSRLSEVNLITTTSYRGKTICKERKFDSKDSDKIPKTLLMSKSLDLRNKAFLISAWFDVEEGVLNHTKKSLHKEIFKELNVGIVWVTSRITELSALGLLHVDGRNININLTKIITLSDTVISDALRGSSKLEEVVCEYENKTGIFRDQIFDWNPNNSEGTEEAKEFNSPKWLQPVIDAMNEGSDMLGKQHFKLNSGELSTLGGHVKQIISEESNLSAEHAMISIVESIIWKADEVIKGNAKDKWWNKGYFTRKQNNLRTNVYFYKEHLLKYPYAKKKNKFIDEPIKNPIRLTPKKKVKKKIDKKKDLGDVHKPFDYGIEDF